MAVASPRGPRAGRRAPTGPVSIAEPRVPASRLTSSVHLRKWTSLAFRRLRMLRRIALGAVLLIPACARSSALVGLSSSSASFTAADGGPDPADQIVSLQGARNLYLGAATWTATVDRPWLTVTPSSGLIGRGQTVPLTLHASHLPEAWTGATSTVGAPAIGLGAWNGSAMFVWTGDPTVPGTYYDPATDTWSGTTSLVNAPSLRLPTRVVWTGKEMIV